MFRRLALAGVALGIAVAATAAVAPPALASALSAPAPAAVAMRAAPASTSAAAGLGHDFGQRSAAKWLSCKGSAKITGSFGLDVSQLKSSFAKWGTKNKGEQFKAYVGWATTISATLHVTAATTCTPGPALKKIAFPFTIGGVKIALSPDFKLVINAKGSVTASQTTTQSVTVSGKLGLSLPTVTHTLTPGKPAVTASGSATFDAVIGANALITAGLVKLDFQLMGGVHATATAQTSPAGVCVRGYPELLATGTISLTFFDWKKNKEFLDHTWPITSVGGHSTVFSFGRCPVVWTATEGKLPSSFPAGTGTIPDIVSCPTTTFCAAVGGDGGPWDAVWFWHGDSWMVQRVPLPADAAPPPGGSSPYVGLASVSCPSAVLCTVVGDYYTETSGVDTVPLIMTWSDGSWKQDSISDNGPGDAALDGVSCASASFCVAVGTDVDNDTYPSTVTGLLATWTGTAWTAAKASVPASGIPTDVGLTAVSCPAVTSCTAVGHYGDTSDDTDGLLLTLAGHSWSAAKAPLPPGGVPASSVTLATIGLYGVSCPSASFCMAIGQYTDTHGDVFAQVLTKSGGTWTAAEAPVPASAPGSFPYTLNAVSCASAQSCVISGLYNTAPESQYDDLLVKSGNTWSGGNVPAPGNSATGEGGVQGVSCVASFCAAVGGYEDASTEQADPLLLTTSSG